MCLFEMVNFADSKGRAAICSGNVIRNLRPTPGHSGHEFGYECAIKVEADATVSAKRRRCTIHAISPAGSISQ